MNAQLWWPVSYNLERQVNRFKPHWLAPSPACYIPGSSDSSVNWPHYLHDYFVVRRVVCWLRVSLWVQMIYWWSKPSTSATFPRTGLDICEEFSFGVLVKICPVGFFYFKIKDWELEDLFDELEIFMAHSSTVKIWDVTHSSTHSRNLEEAFGSSKFLKKISANLFINVLELKSDF